MTGPGQAGPPQRPVAFGCAISDGCACHPKKARKHGSIVAAGRGASGKILVDLAPFYGPPGLLVARMAVLYARHDPVAVVVNPKSHSGTLVRPLADAGVLVREVTAQEVAVAHGEFLDLVDGGGLEHLDQDPLTAAVRAAQQRPLAGAQAWDPKVAVDQGPLVAATLATWAFARWEELAAPGVWQM
ncbi:MAG TPA: hypothetical protein VFQ68_14520 [Streptosporangiaceae bacterium]|nr:hypothetical protein [Streptosporangiaceae bacterium]